MKLEKNTNPYSAVDLSFAHSIITLKLNYYYYYYYYYYYCTSILIKESFCVCVCVFAPLRATHGTQSSEIQLIRIQLDTNLSDY